MYSWIGDRSWWDLDQLFSNQQPSYKLLISKPHEKHPNDVYIMVTQLIYNTCTRNKKISSFVSGIKKTPGIPSTYIENFFPQPARD